MKQHNATYQRLGDYIREVDVRNKDLKVTTLLGVSISKEFIPSIANTIGTDMSSYKIVEQDQFAYGPVTSRNGEKVSIALYRGIEQAIISQAYSVFEIIDTEQLLPEYLMMWFRRPEFDRYARFKSHGSAREVFSWEEMCDVCLPIPPIARQREIVSEYKMLADRIRLNNSIISALESTAQALYRKMFVDNIDKAHLPTGWRIGTLGEVAEFRNTKINVSDITIDNYISAENMVKDRGGIVQCVSFPEDGRCTEFRIGDILLSNIRPYFKKIWRATFNGGCSNDVLCLINKGLFTQSLLYYSIENDGFFDYVMAGSNGVKMPRGDKQWIMSFPLIIPNNDAIALFENQIKPCATLVDNLRCENSKLTNLQSLLLAKMGQ